MGVEEVQNPILQINEDLLDVLGGVDPVGDVKKGLAQLEFIFEFGNLFVLDRICHDHHR